MSKMTPTARSLKYLRDDGWHAQVVERRIPHGNTTLDLFGFIDILAIRNGEVLAVQTTSRPNVASRVRKITEDCPLLADVRACGWSIHVHGWGQVRGTGTRRKWDVRVVDLS